MNKKYRVALIGSGIIAGLHDTPGINSNIQTHAQGILQNKNLALDCVVNPNADDLNKYAEKWDVRKKYASISGFLDSEKVDIISICSPNNNHYESAAKILLHKNVPSILFIEKPVCGNMEELEKLKELQARSGAMVLINHKRRFDVSHQKVREIISSGYMGKFIEGYFTYYGGWLHNGIHVLDLLDFWFNKEIKYDNMRLTDIGKPADKCIEGTLIIDNCPVELKSFDEKYYQIFEGEFRFTKGRILYRDFGNRIDFELVSKNNIGELELSYNQELNGLQGMQSTFKNIYDALEKELTFGNVDTLREVTLDKIEKTMKSLFIIKDYASADFR